MIAAAPLGMLIAILALISAWAAFVSYRCWRAVSGGTLVEILYAFQFVLFAFVSAGLAGIAASMLRP